MTVERDELGRFPPGVSGNPAGRKKGPSLTDDLRAAMTERDKERLLRKVIASAKRGEQWAVNLIFERLDGKVPNRIQHGGDPENDEPIALNIIRAPKADA